MGLMCGPLYIYLNWSRGTAGTGAIACFSILLQCLSGLVCFVLLVGLSTVKLFCTNFHCDFYVY